jgi:hypothetical protein
VPGARSRPKARPGDRSSDIHHRVRHDRVDKSGKITLRYQGRLQASGVGRTHTRTYVLVLVQDLDIRVLDAVTGKLLRELTLDPAARYQPIDRPTSNRR